MKTVKPCEGGCGKQLRPKRYTKDRAPGTVREEAGGMCQPCNARTKPVKVGPVKKLRTGKCAGCDRNLRERGTKLTDHPGTVAEYAADQCMTCWRHATYGPPKTKEPGFDQHGECASCERRMRPHNSTATQFPGTVKYQAEGMCTTCRRRAQGVSPGGRPLIVGRRPAEATPVAQAVEPVAISEIRDAGAARFHAARKARLEKAERVRQVRIRQEQVQARFIASRRAAA